MARKTKKKEVELKEKKKEPKGAELKGEKKEEKADKKESQLKWIILFMAVIIIVFFVFYFLLNSGKGFKYSGVEFEKIKQGNLVFYLGKFPMTDINGNFVAYFPFYFRNDPRKLSNIEINATIKLSMDVAYAADSGFVESCNDSILAATTLSFFLKSLGLNLFSVTINKTEALMLNRTYASCDDKRFSIIAFQPGKINKIRQEGSCYILEINNCEFMKVTERFLVGFYAHEKKITI